MHHVGIIGTGSYVPRHILTNHDLEKMVDTSDAWILERTGIRERRIATDEETNVTMGRIALERAIKNAGIDSHEIDLLVVGTNTTDPVWPSAAGHMAQLLGLRPNMPFFDVQAGCTGFNYALAIAELRRPDITFWTAWSGGSLLGCGALKELDPGHGEVKSMRTSLAYRRQGVGRAILTQIIEEARRRSYVRLSLETGSMQAFVPARRMYEAFGFTYCAPFADYRQDPHSVYMTLQL